MQLQNPTNLKIIARRYSSSPRKGGSIWRETRRKTVYCVGETGILVEQQPPQGVLVCDHAGLVINQLFQATPGQRPLAHRRFDPSYPGLRAIHTTNLWAGSQPVPQHYSRLEYVCRQIKEFATQIYLQTFYGYFELESCETHRCVAFFLKFVELSCRNSKLAPSTGST